MTQPPEPMRPSIVAAGPGWMVVEKPDGLSVHNEPGRDLCSMVQTLLTRDRQLAEQTAFEPGDRVHAPHRLDRDTSGLLLVCCSAATLGHFGRAFHDNQVQKSYLAVLHGGIERPVGEGIWVFPLTRKAGGRSNPAGTGRHVASRTAFRAIGHSRHYSLAICAPLTGRKHQIRRHAKMAGHPVVGDRRYGTPRSLRFLREKLGFTRLGLHACGLALPLSEQAPRRVVLSRQVPPEFLRLLTGDSPGIDQEWSAILPSLADHGRWFPQGE